MYHSKLEFLQLKDIPTSLKITTKARACIIEPFRYIISYVLQKARVFAIDRHFYPGLNFAVKARNLPLEWRSHQQCKFKGQTKRAWRDSESHYRGLYHKTFYGCNQFCTIVGQKSVCHNKTFLPQSKFLLRLGAYPLSGVPISITSSRVRPDQQGQSVKTKTRSLYYKLFTELFDSI